MRHSETTRTMNDVRLTAGQVLENGTKGSFYVFVPTRLEPDLVTQKYTIGKNQIDVVNFYG